MSNAPTTALLAVNLGTPETPTAPAVRRYLAEFLSDPRVVAYQLSHPDEGGAGVTVIRFA